MIRTTWLSGRNEHVDWIEKLFGISPDGGSGTLEGLIAGAVIAVVLGVAFAVRVRGARPSEKRR
jgi:hypothetical protein